MFAVTRHDDACCGECSGTEAFAFAFRNGQYTTAGSRISPTPRPMNIPTDPFRETHFMQTLPPETHPEACTIDDEQELRHAVCSFGSLKLLHEPVTFSVLVPAPHEHFGLTVDNAPTTISNAPTNPKIVWITMYATVPFFIV